MYKQMLDGAQKSISELKGSEPIIRNNRASLSINDEVCF